MVSDRAVDADRFESLTALGILRRERKKLLKQARRYDEIAQHFDLPPEVANHLWNALEAMDKDIDAIVPDIVE